MYPVTLETEHDPDEVLDYAFDYVDVLVTGETISTSVWATSSNVTIAGGTHTDNIATIWVNAVISSTTSFKLTNTVTTSDGRTYERSMIIEVQEK